MSHDAYSLQGLKQGDGEKAGRDSSAAWRGSFAGANEEDKDRATSLGMTVGVLWLRSRPACGKLKPRPTNHAAPGREAPSHSAHCRKTYKPIRELGSKGHRGYGGIRSRTAVSCDLR
jgi:hypothetical protein